MKTARPGLIPRATYQPILQQRWAEAQREALAAMPGIMAAQLEENLRHAAARGRLNQAQALNRALDAIQRAGVSGHEDQTRALLAQARALLASAGRAVRTRGAGFPDTRTRCGGSDYPASEHVAQHEEQHAGN